MADEPNLNMALTFTEFISMHVENLKTALETLDVNDEQAKVKVEIEASKVHWSELTSSYYIAEEGPTLDSSSTLLSHEWIHKEGTLEWELEVVQDNVNVFRSLQEKYPGGFFLDENDLGPNTTQQLPKWMIDDKGAPIGIEFGLSSTTPFAEGGQAQLFHAHEIYKGEKREICAMKVFKEGTPLRNILKLFPTTMLTNDGTCIEGWFGDENKNLNYIGGVRLLKSNGRFAFLMLRAWGDLRKLINERMLHFNAPSPPFPNPIAFYILHQIAKGMMELHGIGIIHRDLKAANVLVLRPCENQKTCAHYNVHPMHLEPYKFRCLVADYECSVGIVGTGFWRAPEILEAVKNRNISQKPKLFTKQVDVYSFGMTCYEILSGNIPFEKLQTNDYDSVIGGMRPMLPSQIPPWMVDLVNRCWNKDPSMRPSFQEIVEILEPYVPSKE